MINIANVNVIHCSDHFVYVHSFNLDNNELDTYYPHFIGKPSEAPRDYLLHRADEPVSSRVLM